MTTITKPSKAETTAGLLGEYRAFVSLLRSLDESEWHQPSRCDGWVVRDVCAHAVGLASDSFGGRIGQFTADEQAAQRRDATPADLADELEQALASAEVLLRDVTDEQWAGPSGAPDLTLGDGVLTLWYDSWVHRDDVHAATGRPSDTGPGLAASAAYVRSMLHDRGWTAPDGVDIDAIDPHQFVLAGTGRADPRRLGLDETVNLYR